MLTTIVIVAVLAAALAASIWWSAPRPDRIDDLARRIDALLPQTQCRRCTFDGCKPYARAIARSEADINQCPPGGAATASAIADLLRREPLPVDARFGAMPQIPEVAWIDESVCIGCTKCIRACPVDAIVGASKFMHTVIAAECTGCELCIPPCPVDCIEMRPAPLRIPVAVNR